MIKSLRLTSLLALTILMLVSSVLPYIHVSAEEPSTTEVSFETESITLEPGESVHLKRNEDGHRPNSEDNWVYKVHLTSLGATLDYAFVSTTLGNLLDEDGNRVEDTYIYTKNVDTWDYNQGGMAYQKHQSNPNLKLFDDEMLTVMNTSAYQMKLEWRKADENDALIPSYYKSYYNSRDLGLVAEKHGYSAFTEYTIKPNEVYSFTRVVLDDRFEDEIYLPSTIENSKILSAYLSQYIATEITGDGEVKFDVAEIKYSQEYSNGAISKDITNSPYVMYNAQDRLGHTKWGRYFLTWRDTTNIYDKWFENTRTTSMKIKNTGKDDIMVTAPYGSITGEKVATSELSYKKITLKPKERLAYTVLDTSEGNPKVTVLGNKDTDNFYLWGYRNRNMTNQKYFGFKNYQYHTLYKTDQSVYSLTNVSDHNLTVLYPDDFVELRKISPFEDATIISSSLFSNRFSQYFSASGDYASLIADPVDTATGAFTSAINPLAIKGVSDVSIPINYYSTFTTETGAFGRGWETDYNAKIYGGGDSYKVQWSQNRFNDYVLVDGSKTEYVGVDNATKNDKLVITDKDRPEGVLYKKDGTQWIFNFGQVQEVIDRTGNSIAIKRGKYENISSLTDKATGNSLYFSYPDYSKRVESLEDNLGRKVSFKYANDLISSVTDPNGKVTTYEYDDSGRVISSKDNAGKLLFVNTYDDKGRVTKQENNGVTTFSYILDEETGQQTTEVTDRNGNTKKLVHGTDLKLIKEIDENGGEIEKFYDVEGNVTQVIDENGNSTLFSYDSRGNVLTSVNADGVETKYTYDISDNLTSLTVADILTSKFIYENNLLQESEDRWGNKTSYTYNANSQIETMTAPDGGVTSYQYANGLLKTITDPAGVVTTYEHDRIGRLIATLDADGNRTELTYDNNNNLISTKDALGNTTSFVYDSRNRKISEKDSKGNVSTYTYDANNNLKTVTDADGNVTTNDYDAEDQLVKTTDRKGNATEFIHDNTGQIIAVKDPRGNTVSTDYDKAGNILASKDAYGIATSTAKYDNLNRPTSVTDALGNTSVTKYNQWSDVTEVVNALNQATQFSYYDIGMANKVTDANNGVTEQSYDAMNRQSTFTDANGNTTSFVYDIAGRTTGITLQNGSSIHYTYNNKGYLSKTTNARGQEFTYGYDKLGRLTKTTKPEGVVETTYDTNGNVLTKSDENGRVEYKYDNLNRPIEYTDIYGNTNKYAYDENSNLTKLTYPDGKVVKYGYTASNQLAIVTDWNNRKTEYEYDKNGRLTLTKKANGTSETREYDTKGQLTKLSDLSTDDTPLRETEFTYDALGNILSEATNGVGKDNKVYTYDSINRVTDSDSNLGLNNYAYDKQGNITSVLSNVAISATDDATPLNTVSNSASLEMEYGENNWLTAINNQPIQYDEDGNALSTVLNGNLINLQYDSLNRLTQAGETSYKYDVNNNRIELQDQDDTTQFVINPLSQYSQVLMETDETGRITKRYIYGIGLIGEETLDNNYITYHYDYRGSTVVLTDDQGDIVEEFEYGTYGELLSSKEGYRFLYNGRDGVQTDKNGLYNMRARYYNPDIKRFINQDTLLGSIGDSTSLNRYAYVNGNPISLVDPFGLEAQTSGMYNLGKYMLDNTIAVSATMMFMYLMMSDFLDPHSLAEASLSKKTSKKVTKNKRWLEKETADVLPATVAGSFENSAYRTVVTQRDLTLYRVYGGKADMYGGYATNKPVKNRIQAKIDLALKPTWNNSREFEATIQVPRGTTLNVGRVAPQTLKTGTVLKGGAEQLLLPKDYPSSWIVGNRKVPSR